MEGSKDVRNQRWNQGCKEARMEGQVLRRRMYPCRRRLEGRVGPVTRDTPAL
jgi:hypothetical protein